MVISSGNFSSLIYAALHIAGFDIKKEDLMAYRSLGSITPGYPEYGITPGIDITSGPFGLGIGNAIGIAMARRYYQSLITDEDEKLKLFDYDVYCLCSDRDMMEGISTEALSFAAAQKLDHLIFLYNVTNMTSDGSLESIYEEDLIKKYSSLGLYVDYLKDGSNVRDIDKSIASAKRSGKPAIIIIKNNLGKESFNENKTIVYNKPLTVDDVASLRKKWNLFLPPFEVSKDSLIYMQKNITERTDKKYNKWLEMYHKAANNTNPKIREVVNAISEKRIKTIFLSNAYKINDGYREPLIETNLKIMNLIAAKTNLFLGGSADSALTCQTYITSSNMHTNKNILGRNIYFGHREQAMASILNGMAMCGLKVYGSTKLIYADFLKPSLRMTTLMNLPVTYIFTHDTISVGEEGPALQPVEQLTMLRTIPNLINYRPADIIEVMGVWEDILNRQLPSSIIITQNDSPKLPGTNASLVSKGAYIVKKEKEKLDGILISCGSELIYALQIAYDLEKMGYDLRVVSIPSLELFLSEGKEYEKEILDENAKRIVIEAGSSLIWNRIATNNDYILGVNDFGFSGHPQEVLRKMGMDYETLKVKVESLLK